MTTAPPGSKIWQTTYLRQHGTTKPSAPTQVNSRCTQIETGFNKFGRLFLDQQHTSKDTGPNQDTPGIPTQSSQNLTKKVTNWKTWAYTDGSCKLHQGKQVTGAGVYHPTTSIIHCQTKWRGHHKILLTERS